MVPKLALCVLALSLQVACSKPPPPPRMVMLNVYCTLGKDMLQPYDSSVEYTPNLKRFAEQGVVFERHVTETGQSGVAFASILSGEHAMRHLVYSHPTRLTDAIQTLPEAFAEAGYDTYFWERQGMGSIALNYDQGIPENQAFARRALVESDPTFQAILKRLKDDPTYKVFIISFYSLTHSLYSRGSLDGFCQEYPGQCQGIDPENAALVYDDPRRLTYNFPSAVEKYDLKGERLEELVGAVELIYKSRVSYTDEVFGGIVQALDQQGLAEESLIAFTADHGETLYRENSLFKWSHSFDFDPDVMNVPFIGRGPGIVPRRHTGASSSADVFPTLAALAGVPIKEGQATFGSDLTMSSTGCTGPPQKIVFSHTGLWPPIKRRWWMTQPRLLKFHPSYDPASVWVSARADDLIVKYRHDGSGKFVYEAYDLAADPKETRNIFDAEDARQRELVEHLDRYRKILIDAHVDPRKKTPQGPQPDEATMIEQLRALGYID
ncbi:MAG: sulfatase-like hydrolase/transferase [Myxococcales bacterium]|nr:sulfatase-like hydrolase/transferase [Myxococcales bacterium]MDH3485010.1 sulfatase-like hydrolase/transferase [Myxococcales bacterium]